MIMVVTKNSNENTSSSNIINNKMNCNNDDANDNSSSNLHLVNADVHNENEITVKKNHSFLRRSIHSEQIHRYNVNVLTDDNDDDDDLGTVLYYNNGDNKIRASHFSYKKHAKHKVRLLMHRHTL